MPSHAYLLKHSHHKKYHCVRIYFPLLECSEFFSNITSFFVLSSSLCKYGFALPYFHHIHNQVLWQINKLPSEAFTFQNADNISLSSVLIFFSLKKICSFRCTTFDTFLENFHLLITQPVHFTSQYFIFHPIDFCSFHMKTVKFSTLRIHFINRFMLQHI